ncbi:DNA gyrase subunit A chloroplastic/mitochondrial-like [Trifolium pratense]|uniref:DNA topoisomerase (ATP-hydrolyzing) n=1 Tax=Trifolium pratense TaxID=57577 RepID=A0A2K3NL29_TRIPR|nr:DNA gyrase subunit A chloroplastic/mitochondrial-like [Trifolium pratense]
MHELGLSSKKPFKKCARVVGEVLGKFHPHGDGAVYDSMVRMAQDFSLRSPLVNGHGNFGSIDADPPAAMRYTECRLEELAEAVLLADLDQDTVDFVPNFDNSQKEPSFLPARLPNLLLNGSSGIAVGMATNIPPHNLAEVVDVLCVMIHNPEATLQELLEYMPGPDFPTGGIIMGNLGILEAYRTGRGRVIVRGKTDVELLDSKSKRSAIIIKEIPYQTNKSALVEKIADLVESKTKLESDGLAGGGGSSGTHKIPVFKLHWALAFPFSVSSIPFVLISSLLELELIDNKPHVLVGNTFVGPFQRATWQWFVLLECHISTKSLNCLRSLDGISDIRDESDRSGMRVVIELKRGSDPLIVLNNLYRLTSLQSTFSCNMVGILNGKPKQMGLKEILQAFLDFRCYVVERRARFQLSKAQQRRHIVEGILVGFDNLDGVIRIIREASSNSIAAVGLRNGELLILKFNLSEKQAEALLDMSLRRLTLRESDNFVAENKSLTEHISKLEELLSSRKNILECDIGLIFVWNILGLLSEEVLTTLALKQQLVDRSIPGTLVGCPGQFLTQNQRDIGEEAIDLKNKFASPRRSILEDTDDGQLEDIDVIPNEEMLLTLSEKGYLKRMKPNTFTQQNRGTIGKSVGKLKMNDSMSDFIVCHAHDHVLYFSDKGTVYSARAYKIPECSRTASGTPLVQILSLSDGERITSIIPVSEFTEDQFLLMLTVQGYIKRVPLNSFSSIRSSGIIAIQLVPGDELKWVRCCTNDDFVAMASHNGMIRTQGRNTRGALAMRLKEGDRMASVDIIPAAMWNDLETISKLPGTNVKSHDGPWLLFISESGHGKRVPLSRFRMSSLNRVGLIGYKFSAEDRLAAVFVVGFSLAEDGESDEEVVLVSQSGTVNRIKVRDISIQSRFARGVILMRLDHAGKIQSASLISATESEPEEVLDIAAQG